MTVDRSKWERTFARKLFPLWPCPWCNSGSLLLQKDSVTTFETIESKKKKHKPGWYPNDEEGRFIGALECSQQQCSDSVVIAGTYGYWPDFQEDLDFDQYLTVCYVDPAPHLFTIPSKCPPLVVERLKQAFQLYWIDANASANRLRAAVEHLMDSQGINKRRRNKPGKQERLSLHSRIRLFQQRNSNLGDLLLAVKWLGNSGSHKEQLSSDDLLDGFEILDHVLEELYARRRQAVTSIAKQINKKKGPRGTKSLKL